MKRCRSLKKKTRHFLHLQVVQQKLTADIQKSFLLISEKNSCRDPRSINPTKLVRRIHNLWINGMSYQFNWQSPYLSDPSNVAHQPQLSEFSCGNFDERKFSAAGAPTWGKQPGPPKKSRDTTFGVQPTNQQTSGRGIRRPKKNVCPPQLRHAGVRSWKKAFFLRGFVYKPLLGGSSQWM